MKSRPLTIAILLIVASSFVPFDVDARGRRVRIDEIEGQWNTLASPLALAGDQTATFQMPMSLLIGSSIYTHITVYENGFVSFSATADGPVVEPQMGAANLAAIPGNVVAMLYTDLVCDDVRPTADPCEIGYADLDLVSNPDNTPPGGEPIAFLKGVRVTWGGTSSLTAILNPLEDPATELADDLINFQLRIIDRSDQTYGTGTAGDFDLELSYLGADDDTVNWTSTPLIAGISAGGEILDFAALGSFLNNVDSTGLVVDCRGAPEPVPDSPDEQSFVSFDPAYPLPCNFITVEFRSGIPNLRTFTADLGVGFATAPAAVNAAEDFEMALQIDNAGPDTADTVSVTVDVPTGTRLNGFAPTSAQCSLANNTISCGVEEIDANSSAPVSLTLQQEAAGSFDYAAGVAARQYDARTADNSASTAIAVSPSADVSIVSCGVSPTSITNGGIVTASCVLRNDGPQDATDLRLTVSLPTVVNFTSSSDCVPVSGNLECDIALLAQGMQLTVAANFTSTTVGAGVFTATLTAGQHDQDTADNGPVQATLTVAARPVIPPETGGGGTSAPAFLVCLLIVNAYSRRRRGQL